MVQDTEDINCECCGENLFKNENVYCESCYNNNGECDCDEEENLNHIDYNVIEYIRDNFNQMPKNIKTRLSRTILDPYVIWPKKQ